MEEMNNQKELKGKPILEHTIMMGLLRREFWWTRNPSSTERESLVNAFLLVIISILLVFTWKNKVKNSTPPLTCLGFCLRWLALLNLLSNKPATAVLESPFSPYIYLLFTVCKHLIKRALNVPFPGPTGTLPFLLSSPLSYSTLLGCWFPLPFPIISLLSTF